MGRSITWKFAQQAVPAALFAMLLYSCTSGGTGSADTPGALSDTLISQDGPSEHVRIPEQDFSFVVDSIQWNAVASTIELLPSGNAMGNITRVGGKHKGSSLFEAVYLAYPDGGAADTTIHLQGAEETAMMLFKGPRGTMFVAKYLDLHIRHVDEGGQEMVEGTFSGELTDMLHPGSSRAIRDGHFRAKGGAREGHERDQPSVDAPITWVANGVEWRAPKRGFTELVGKEAGDSTWVAAVALEPAAVDQEGLFYVNIRFPYPSGTDSTVHTSSFRQNFGIEFMMGSREGRVRYKSGRVDASIHKEWNGERFRLVAHFTATMKDDQGKATEIDLTEGVLRGGWKKPGVGMMFPQ